MAGYSLKKEIGSAQQHQASHGTMGHLPNQSTPEYHSQSSHGSVGHIASHGTPGHQSQSSHGSVGHIASHGTPGHQSQSSHGSVGHIASHSTLGDQHQMSHGTAGHLASYGSAGHHGSMDHLSVQQHSHQPGQHGTITTGHDGHVMATRHISVTEFGNGHHHQDPHHASHYEIGSHHLTTDSIDGHHSGGGTMKRSLSVPIIPVLEAIHFDHIHTYTPENESLMEREVKIVRQREAALD